jgi:hypothetical protein
LDVGGEMIKIEEFTCSVIKCSVETSEILE